MLSESEVVHIRALVQPSDALAVYDLYNRAADYVAVERGMEPDDSIVEEFFADCPPGADRRMSQKLGLFVSGDQLAAIADLAFGYPRANDAYIGLMLFDESFRGRGLGRLFLDHLVALARARGAPRLLLAVFNENTRGRAFWEREGFRVVQTSAPSDIGRKTHFRHRMERWL